MQKAGVLEWRVEIKPSGTVAVYAGRGSGAGDAANPWDAMDAPQEA